MALASPEGKLGDRYMHEAVIIGFETIPLNKNVEDSHSECQFHTEVLPHSRHGSFELTHRSKHGQNSLHPHALVPLSLLAKLEIGRIAFSGMKPHISQHNFPQGVLRGVSRLAGAWGVSPSAAADPLRAGKAAFVIKDGTTPPIQVRNSCLVKWIAEMRLFNFQPGHLLDPRKPNTATVLSNNPTQA